MSDMTYTVAQVRQLNLHDPQTVMELCDELEIAQKQAAAMREALEIIDDMSARLVWGISDKALKSDASENYVSKEQVKSLVEAIESMLESAKLTYSESAEFHGREADLMIVDRYDVEKVESALEDVRIILDKPTKSP